MSRHPFGWSLPPGVSNSDIDPPEQPCEVCGRWSDSCICPECPVCSQVGDHRCYEEHGLQRTKVQVLGWWERRLDILRQEVFDCELQISHLEDIEESSVNWNTFVD